MFDTIATELTSVIETPPSPAGLELLTDELVRVGELSELALMRTLLAYQRSGEFRIDGHQSAASAVAIRLGIDKQRLRRLVGFAKKLEQMPTTSAAVLEGKIGLDHARAIAPARRPDTEYAFDAPDGEAFLVSKAADPDLTYADFKVVVAHWIDVNSSDDEDERREARDATCDLRTGQDFDGTTHVDGKLPPLVGDEFCAELRRLEKHLFAQDWAQAKELHGSALTLDHLTRTPQQRRVDALALMARRSAAYEGDPPPSRIVINIVIDHNTFTVMVNHRLGDGSLAYPQDRTCQTLAGTPLTTADTFEALTHGRVRTMVLDPDTHILRFGRAKRLFTGALRDAIKIRHLRCQWPHGCDMPADHCEIDHTQDWQDGGLTDHDNAKPLCKHHNLTKQYNRARRSPPDPDE